MPKLVVKYRGGNEETFDVPDGHDPHANEGFVTLPLSEDDDPDTEPFKIDKTYVKSAKVKRS